MRRLQFRDPWWTAVIFVGGCEAVGLLSARIGGVHRANPWIDETPKPALWPPAWAFPSVWAIVNYPALGLATWLEWKRRHDTSIVNALRHFVALLGLNAAFLPLVYRVKTRSFFVEMDLLGALLTTMTARSYARVSRPGAYAITPYASWMWFTTIIKALWWRMEKVEPMGNQFSRR